MSNITLTIGGRAFVVACAPGEEEHVAGLARSIDGKLAKLGDMSGQSEARVLLFAALLLADELHEHDDPERRAARVADEARGDDAVLAERLGAVADRLENLAARLEGDAASA